MSLRVWLPLNGDIKNYGASDYTTYNYGASINASGKIGSCYSFNSNVQIGVNSIEIGDDFSVCYWVKYNDLSYPRTHVGIRHSSGAYTSSNKGWDIGHGPTGGGTYNFDINDGSNIQRISLGATNLTELNVWKHFALVCSLSNRKVKLYINGTLASEENISASIGSFKITRDLEIGGLYGWYLNGYLNDFRVYDHCLSPDEVKEISKALVLYYPLSDAGIEPTTNLLASSADVNCKSLTGYTANQNVTLSVDIMSNGLSCIKCVSNQSSSTPGVKIGNALTLKQNTNYTFSAIIESNCYALLYAISSVEPHSGYKKYTTPERVSLTFNTGSYTSYTMYVLMSSMSTGQYFKISQVQFEEKDHVTPFTPSSRAGLVAEDCSGYNRNGTVTASTCPVPVSGSARNSMCYQFDGSDDYIVSSVKQGDILADKKFTISAWVYLTDFREARGILGPHESSPARGICFCQCNGSSNKMICSLGDGSGWHAIYDDTGYSLNTWTLYTMTYDGTTAKMYKNGSYVGATTGNIVYADNSITVGRAYNGGDRYWKGKISDVKVYATALSADDIAQEYHRYAAIYNNHSFAASEFIEESENIFTSENVQKYATSSTGAYGQWTTRNSVPAMAIEPNRFYHADSRDQEVLKDYFAPNTQYIFDMWIDSDDVVYNNNNVPGGFVIYYTDGSTDSTFVVGGNHSSPIGFQHKRLVTPAGKSIKGIGIYYYTSVPVYYKAGSFISQVSRSSIGTTGVCCSSWVENDVDKVSVFPEGEVYTTQLIETI